jgi:hypothetical protein
MFEFIERMRRPQFLITLSVCFLSGLILGGCGKRADHVTMPPDVPDSSYPRVYPDPTADPAP